MEAHTLKTFRDRLRDLCDGDGQSPGSDRLERAAHETQQAYALARELEILRDAGQTFEQFLSENSELRCGTEHVIEFDDEVGRVAKITVPPKFGLIPAAIATRQANLRDAPNVPEFRMQVEFIQATPLEYLDRWLAANEVFEDDVRLTSVIVWSDGKLSIAISQPQYHGTRANQWEIESYFIQDGWKRIPDASGHLIFYNYAFDVLAIDALERNCNVKGGQLLPFDVILCHPSQELQDHLHLYS